MIARPPSLLREYDEFCAFDPAFDQTEDDGRLEKVRTARETGDWSGLLVNGQQPVKYVMRRLGSEWRELADRAGLPPNNPRRIGQATAAALLFRMACVRIVGGPEGTEGNMPREPDPRWDGWTMLPASAVEALDAIDQRIVTDLGAAVLERVRGSPK